MSWRFEEKGTISLLYAYTFEAIDARLVFEYAFGESYIVTYFTAYESGNYQEIEDEIDSAEEEFFVLTYRVEEVLTPGAHNSQKGEFIDIDYRDFPLRIVKPDGLILYHQRAE